MLDIAKEEILRKYLIQNNIFSDSDKLRIHYFPGGVSGTVAFASDGIKEVVIKQALPFLKVAAEWECDPSRMIIEQKALEVYSRLVPSSVPAPISFDMDELIMVREAAPESCVMWKAQLLEGLLDFRVAEKSIRTLLDIHNKTANDEAVRQDFIDDSFFYKLRISPYIEVVVEKYPKLKEKSISVIDFLMNKKIALVHGDYSPKNLLVDGDKIFVLDLEVAHYGHPAFDMAFFSNHFLLKAIKNRAWSRSYLNMLSYMSNIYFSEVDCMDTELLEKETVETLAFLLLARVDGKSPAEYITGDRDKELVRTAAFTILDEKMIRLSDVTACLERLIQEEG